MATEASVEQLREIVAVLCAPLHRSLEVASEQTQATLAVRHLATPKYRWLATHFTRAGAHRELCRADLGHWAVTGTHERNGELWLTNGLTTMRLLHTLSATDVPAPGCNTARKAYYRNPPLLKLPVQQAFEELQVSRLLGLWRMLDPTTFEVGIRVVRTVGDWQYGSKHVTDVDFLLPRTPDELASLTFEPDDTDTWLDVPDDDTDAQEEGSGDAG